MIENEVGLGPPIPFYNGEVILRFHEEDHIYYREYEDGHLEPQDGVTRICGILDKSFYLMPWAVKMMALKLIRTIPMNPDANPPRILPALLEDFVQLVESAKKAHKEIFEDAGDIGHWAHAWIEDSIKLAMANTEGIVEKMSPLVPGNDQAANCGLAAFAWMKAHNVRWLRTERKIYSRKYEYAGTMDGLALVDSCENPICCARWFLDELSLIDWKSSNHLSLDYLMQTAAYEQAEEEEFGVDIKARWILRLGKDDGKFEPWYERDFERDFHAFLCCLEMKRAHEAIETRMREAKKLKTFIKRQAKKEMAPKKVRKKKEEACPPIPITNS